MPITTLEDLFAAGAHNTVLGVLERNPEAGVNTVRDALFRRFGAELQADTPTISNLLGRVARGMTIADQINRGETPGADLPAFPGAPADYQYTVLVSVRDPDAPDDDAKRIEIPITLPSDEPLDLDAIRADIEELLADWQPARDTIPGGPAADLIRRDVLVRSRILNVGNLPAGLFDADVLIAYRRG